MISQTEYYREYRRRKEGKPDYQPEDMIQCLLCQKYFVFIGAHVRQTHKMFMLDYKKRFGLDTKRGKTTGQFRKLKRDTNRGVKNLEKGKKYRLKKGMTIPYERTLETLERLRKQGVAIGRKYGGDRSEPERSRN